MILFICPKALRRIIREELEDYFKRNVMALITDVQAKVDALVAALADVDTKLDTIAALVQQLEGGQVATQAQVDALDAAVTAAQVTVSDVQTKEGNVK